MPEKRKCEKQDFPVLPFSLSWSLMMWPRIIEFKYAELSAEMDIAMYVLSV